MISPYISRELLLMYMYNCSHDTKNISFYFMITRKVFLGHKKNHESKKYAIKVMKKSDMVNKNMVNQGKSVEEIIG